MLKIQYILIASLFLLIVFTYIIHYRDGISFLLNFLLRPKTFATLSAKRAVEKECKSNIGFKERCEKDENWKNEQFKRFKEQFLKSTLSIAQIASAFLILWAIIGKLGYSIQTIGGESMPEVMDKFWFIVLNIIGIFSLFFTQFYSFFKK